MPRLRDPQRTRRTVLEASYREFYRHGFQGGSLNRIVESAGTTKGALFHHFAGKKELGYAVMDELLAPAVHQWWVVPLEGTDDPIPVLQAVLHRLLKRIEHENPKTGFVHHGCPICNYAAEMAPLDEGFRRRLDQLYSAWRQAVSRALQRGQKSAQVRRDISPDEEAAFLVAFLAGAGATGKVGQELSLFQHCFRVAQRYLLTLRP